MFGFGLYHRATAYDYTPCEDEKQRGTTVLWYCSGTQLHAVLLPIQANLDKFADRVQALLPKDSQIDLSTQGCMPLTVLMKVTLV